MNSEPLKNSLPNSAEAEMNVLGSILLDNSVIQSLIGRITPDSFYNPVYHDIYQAMLKLDKNNNVIEPLTIKNIYGSIEHKTKLSDDELMQYLIEIIDFVPNAVYVETYINIIIEKEVERKLLANMDKIRHNILNNKLEYKEVLDSTEADIVDLLKNRNANDMVHISKAAQDYYDDLIKRGESNDKYIGIITDKYSELDKLTTGFKEGEFIILAARPAVGKTAFALNLASLFAHQDKSVVVFSLEMSVDQLMQRMYCMESSVDANKLKSGTLDNEEKVAISAANHQLQGLKIYFDDSGSNSIGDIRAKCRQLHHKNAIDILIIDYLQLINSDDKKNRQEEVSQISRSLKQLARELHIPVIALSQLSRSIETRDNKMPVLADLRESGSLEQDADMVMFLFKRSDIEGDDEYDSNFDNNTPKKEKEDNIRQVVLNISKNRQGGLGHVDFDFYSAQSKFIQSDPQLELIPNKKKKRKNNNN